MFVSRYGWGCYDCGCYRLCVLIFVGVVMLLSRGRLQGGRRYPDGDRLMFERVDGLLRYCYVSLGATKTIVRDHIVK